MNNYDILNIFLLIYIILFLFTKFSFNKKPKITQTKDKNTDQNSKDNNIDQKTNQNILNQNTLNQTLKKRDTSVLNDKLVAPERRHEKHNYRIIDKSLKINEYTRGEPESYQIVGILFKEDQDKKYQLFGRKTYPSSLEWEYYIGGRDSGGLDYKYPLDTNQEIYDNTEIINPIDNNTYNVKIYNFNKPRYIPYI